MYVQAVLARNLDFIRHRDREKKHTEKKKKVTSAGKKETVRIAVHCGALQELDLIELQRTRTCYPEKSRPQHICTKNITFKTRKEP